jgi:excisionase family DNA binding protein
MEKRLMNIKELSEYLATSKGSIYVQVHEGKIPPACIVKLGRALRFEREAINAWVDKQRLSAQG